MEVLPTDHFQPDILLSGLRLGEPVIALTALLSAFIALYGWWMLRSDASLRWYRVFFLLMGISTIIGAIVGHLFLYCLPFAYKLPGWVTGMLAVSAFGWATIDRAKPYMKARNSNVLKGILLAELLATLLWVISVLWFPVVEIHSAFVLLFFVTPLEAWLYRSFKAAGSLQFLSGIALLVAGVLVHIFKISLGIWFCYFDIAHLLMCFTLWQFYLGALATRNSVPT